MKIAAHIRLFLQLPFVLAGLSLAASPLHGEAGLEITQGAGDYRQHSLYLAVPLNRTLAAGAQYSQVSSVDAPAPVKTYSANLGVALNDHWNIRGNVLNSPEANGAKAAGWGMTGSYGGWSDHADWSLSLAVNQTCSSQYWQSQTTVQRYNKRNSRTTVTTSSGWQNLTQNNITPSLAVDLFSAVSLSFGCALYAYDRDVGDFSGELAAAGPVEYSRGSNSFSTSTHFGDLPSLMNGFPVRLLSAGIAVSPVKQVRAGYDWSRTEYMIDQPPVEASTFSIAYTFRSFVRMRLGYSIFSTNDAYVTAGMQLLW